MFKQLLLIKNLKNLWDINKINKDINNKKNINNIWRLCKYYLMLEGFKESFVSLKNEDTEKESFNNLSN